jgi:hypothetical protein
LPLLFGGERASEPRLEFAPLLLPLPPTEPLRELAPLLFLSSP